MKFYLSSYKIGNKGQILAFFFKTNKKIAIIPNAIDYKTDEEISESINRNKENLAALDLEPVTLNLKDYFNKKAELKQFLNTVAGVWVRGGNTFILRQAMKLSGFDNIIKSFKDDKSKTNFVYAGYSAGICILAPSLKGLQIVDNPNINPYIKTNKNTHKEANKEEKQETIWEGLDLLDYLILPHYQSDHPESKDINKEVQFCKDNNIKFKTLRDGEVIVIE